MTNLVRVGIAGTGSYVPDNVVTNDDLARLVDTSDEWITQRTGIKERRLVDANTHCSDLCVGAARVALERAGVAPEELDLILVGTVTADFLLPTAACLVQEKLGAKNAAAMDVQAACTGFLNGLATGEAFIAAGRARKVLVIGAETLSRIVDWTDRTSCILFGDGAGAVVLRPWQECEQGEILNTILGADGSRHDVIHIPNGGGACPPTHPEYDKGEHFIRLRGREVYRFAVTKMTQLVRDVCAGYDEDEIGLLVPHQVNRRIIEASLERLGWSEERCVINIQKYGNTSAASVPIALHEADLEGRLQKGQLAVMVAFGSGLTWGASLVRW
jgi:3-oxoacyl-[acyl-carrier-protein] synthase-3